jgi:O-antigen/teichoic acid export membrane protein
VSGSAVYGLGAVLVQFINIILMPFLTAHMTTREFGAAAVLNFASLCILAVFSLGLSSSIGLCYFDYVEKSKRDALIWSAMVVLSISVAGMTLIGMSSIGIWPTLLLDTGEFRDAAVYMLLATGVAIIVLPLDAKLRLDERPKAFVLASLITTASIGSLTLWLVIVSQLGVRGYFLALFIGRVISLVSFCALTMRGTRICFQISMAKTLVTLGAPLVPQFALLYMLQYGNVGMLKRLIGLDASGVYFAGLTIGFASNVIISSIASAWAPFFLSYASKRDEAVRLFGDITAYYVFGVGCFTLLFYYLAQPLTLLLSAPEYAAAYRVVGLTATAMYVLGLYNFLLPPSYFAKEAKKLTYLLAAAALAHFACGYLLVSALGVIGAAWSLVVSYGILNGLLYRMNIRQGTRYFMIEYDWRRVLVFWSAYLVSVMVLSQVDLLPHLFYVLFCVFHFGLMLLLTYMLLRRDEKTAIKSLVYQSRKWLRRGHFSGQSS